jgi:hypothetical protein
MCQNVKEAKTGVKSRKKAGESAIWVQARRALP